MDGFNIGFWLFTPKTKISSFSFLEFFNSIEIAKEMGHPAAYELGHDMQFMGATPVLRSDIFLEKLIATLVKVHWRKPALEFTIWSCVKFMALTLICNARHLKVMAFCEIGEAAKLWADGECGPGGKLPCTTMGDATGRGHVGSGQRY